MGLRTIARMNYTGSKLKGLTSFPDRPTLSMPLHAIPCFCAFVIRSVTTQLGSRGIQPQPPVLLQPQQRKLSEIVQIEYLLGYPPENSVLRWVSELSVTLSKATLVLTSLIIMCISIARHQFTHFPRGSVTIKSQYIWKRSRPDIFCLEDGGNISLRS
jgi:hypothetical protein